MSFGLSWSCLIDFPYGVAYSPYGGFLKWWYPTTMGFPTKNDHFGGPFSGYHHLRKHPYFPIKRCKFFGLVNGE